MQRVRIEFKNGISWVGTLFSTDGNVVRIKSDADGSKLSFIEKKYIARLTKVKDEPIREKQPKPRKKAVGKGTK